MERRNFFKKLGIGIGGLIIAPKLLAESVKEDVVINEITKIPEFVKDKILMHQLNKESYINEFKVFKAIIKDKHFFTFKEKHNIRIGDKIFVSLGGMLESVYRVTDSTDLTIKAFPVKKNFMLNGGVEVIIIGRPFRFYPTKNENYDGLKQNDYLIDEISRI